MSASHEVFVKYATRGDGAVVGCSCGWVLWLRDVPVSVEGMARLVWLLERRDEHPILARLGR
jgi:hypothetical protein